MIYRNMYFKECNNVKIEFENNTGFVRQSFISSYNFALTVSIMFFVLNKSNKNGNRKVIVIGHLKNWK